MLAQSPESAGRAAVLRMHLLLGLLGAAVAGLVLVGDISPTHSVMYNPRDSFHWAFFWAFLSFAVVAPFVLIAPGLLRRDARLSARGFFAGVLFGFAFAFTSVPEFVWVDHNDRKLLLRFAGLFAYAASVSTLSVFLVTQNRDAALRAAVRSPLLALTAVLSYAFISNMFNRMWMPTYDEYCLPMRIGMRVVVEGLIIPVLPLAVALDWIPLSQGAARWIWWVLFVAFAINVAVLFQWPDIAPRYSPIFAMALFPTYIYWFWNRLNWAQRIVPLLPAILLVLIVVISYWRNP